MRGAHGGAAWGAGAYGGAVTSRTVSSTTVVEASPERVFAILADPRQHQRFDGSGTLRGSVAGPETLGLGSEFEMAMKQGAAYRTRNTVVEFEQDRLIAWRHFAPHRWRYELEPVNGGTKVTETWDASRVPAPWWFGLRLTGYPARSRRGIEASLVNLAHAAEADESNATAQDGTA